MKRMILGALGVLALAGNTFAQAPADDPIEKALMAAPRNLKEAATVIKWKPDYTYDTLKKRHQPSGVLRPIRVGKRTALLGAVHQPRQSRSRRPEQEDGGHH